MITWQEARQLAPKKRDTWTRVLLLNWWATPLTYLIARYTRMDAKGLTYIGATVGALSALMFSQEKFVTGALLYFLHFALDGMDGKLSRIRKEDDTYRGMMDFTLDGIVCALVVIGLAVGYNNYPLTTLLLVWMSLHFLDMRFGAMVYNLKATRGIASSGLIGNDVEEMYGKSTLMNTYIRVQAKLEKFGMNALPTTGEAAFLMFVIGPITGWAHVMTMLGIFCTVPAMVGNYVLAYKLAKKEPK
jgi:phosphatidylglycerophosphate synthase